MADGNEKLEAIEQRQIRIENDIVAINEMLELLIARSHGRTDEKFRSHRSQFGGYGARNIAAKLRDRGDQKSDASRRKADGYRRTAGKPLPPLPNI